MPCIQIKSITHVFIFVTLGRPVIVEVCLHSPLSGYTPSLLMRFVIPFQCCFSYLSQQREKSNNIFFSFAKVVCFYASVNVCVTTHDTECVFSQISTAHSVLFHFLMIG